MMANESGATRLMLSHALLLIYIASAPTTMATLGIDTLNNFYSNQTTNQRSKMSAASDSIDDQLPQEQRLALQIVTTDSENTTEKRPTLGSLNNAEQSLPSLASNQASKQHEYHTTLEQSSSLPLIARNSQTNSDLDTDALQTASDGSFISFEDQYNLLESRLSQSQDANGAELISKGQQPLRQPKQQLLAKRIVINLSSITSSQGDGNETSADSSRGPQLTIGFASAKQQEQQQQPATTTVRPFGSSVLATNRRAASGNEKSEMRPRVVASSATIREAVMEAVRRQGGVPTFVLDNESELTSVANSNFLSNNDGGDDDGNSEQRTTPKAIKFMVSSSAGLRNQQQQQQQQQLRNMTAIQNQRHQQQRLPTIGELATDGEFADSISEHELPVDDSANDQHHRRTRRQQQQQQLMIASNRRTLGHFSDKQWKEEPQVRFNLARSEHDEDHDERSAAAIEGENGDNSENGKLNLNRMLFISSSSSATSRNNQLKSADVVTDATRVNSKARGEENDNSSKFSRAASEMKHIKTRLGSRQRELVGGEEEGYDGSSGSGENQGHDERQHDNVNDNVGARGHDYGGRNRPLSDADIVVVRAATDNFDAPAPQQQQQQQQHQQQSTGQQRQVDSTGKKKNNNNEHDNYENSKSSSGERSANSDLDNVENEQLKQRWRATAATAAAANGNHNDNYSGNNNNNNNIASSAHSRGRRRQRDFKTPLLVDISSLFAGEELQEQQQEKEQQRPQLVSATKGSQGHNAAAKLSGGMSVSGQQAQQPKRITKTTDALDSADGDSDSVGSVAAGNSNKRVLSSLGSGQQQQRQRASKMDETVAQFMDRLRLYTTRDQLMKVAQELQAYPTREESLTLDNSIGGLNGDELTDDQQTRPLQQQLQRKSASSSSFVRRNLALLAPSRSSGSALTGADNSEQLPLLSATTSTPTNGGGQSDLLRPEMARNKVPSPLRYELIDSLLAAASGSSRLNGAAHTSAAADDDDNVNDESSGERSSEAKPPKLRRRLMKSGRDGGSGKEFKLLKEFRKSESRLRASGQLLSREMENPLSEGAELAADNSDAEEASNIGDYDGGADNIARRGKHVSGAQGSRSAKQKRQHVNDSQDEYTNNADLLNVLRKGERLFANEQPDGTGGNKESLASSSLTTKAAEDSSPNETEEIRALEEIIDELVTREKRAKGRTN